MGWPVLVVFCGFQFLPFVDSSCIDCPVYSLGGSSMHGGGLTGVCLLLDVGSAGEVLSVG